MPNLVKMIILLYNSMHTILTRLVGYLTKDMKDLDNIWAKKYFFQTIKLCLC